jgi:hypothetical protein
MSFKIKNILFIGIDWLMFYQIISFVLLAILVGNYFDKRNPRMSTKKNFPLNTKKYTAFVLGSTGAIGKVFKKKI